MNCLSAFRCACYVALLGIAASTFGCSIANDASDPLTPNGDEPTPAGGSGAAVPEGGSAGSEAQGGAGGSTAEGGSGGNVAAGGSGGEPNVGGAAPTGRPGMATVAGGGLSKSNNYTLWFTVGESPGGTGKTQTSSNYTHKTGLVVTTQP